VPTRLLFASTDPYIPEAYGGCEVNTHALCGLLQRQGAAVAILADFAAGGWRGRRQASRRVLLGRGPIAHDSHLGYPVYRRPRPWNAAETLVERIRPTAVVVQSCGQMIRLVRAFLAQGVPAIVYLHNIDFDHYGGDCFADPRVRYIVPSAFVGRRLLERFGIAADIVPPVFVPENYRVETSREVVTFVNPRPHKGVDIVLQLARRRPDIPFELVESWPLDRAAAKALLAQLTSYPNVRLVRRSLDMRGVYARSRLVLVPSRCEEAWGRIVTEAQISGIPALASGAGALPEAVGAGGLLVDPAAPPAAWEAALARLWDTPDDYARFADAARRQASSDLLRPEIAVRRLLDAAEQLAAGPGRAGPAG
jgi:glycosyltransferase involved in cell wall biosynthesis